MNRVLAVVTLFGLNLLFTTSVAAQNEPNPALNSPDKLAWTIFLDVNSDAKSAGNNNARFETWASDGDTFEANPVWPATPSPLHLKPRALGFALQRFHAQDLSAPEKGPTNGDGKQERVFVVPGGDATEETRRNKPDFDFIVRNNLFRVSGLKAAFAANNTLSFPMDSLEVKGNWVALSQLKSFNGFSGTPEEAAKIYHVNSAGGKLYALVSMHVISKLIPNWTWATFEHKDNPGRCDVIGCRDAFGASQLFVPPQSQTESNAHYSDCLKTDDLKKMFAQTQIDPAFVNYCLKGSQSDFVETTGLSVRLGNSVTENGFVNQASCMTCHGRAAFNASGTMTSFAGFDLNAVGSLLTGNGPVGALNPNWFWLNDGRSPSYPMFASRGPTKIAEPADFVWSVPFCAIDDTAKPPQTKSRFCAGK